MNNNSRTYPNGGMIRRVCCLLLCLTLLTGSLQALAVPAEAAVAWPSFDSSTPIRAYTNTSSKKFPVYNSNHKKKKTRWLRASDDILIVKISGSWAKIKYHWDGERKTGYAPLSTFTAVSAPVKKFTAQVTATAYRRSSGNGTTDKVKKGRTVYALRSSGNRTQILYSVKSSSGKIKKWRMGWVQKSDYSQLLAGDNASSLTISGVTKPTTLAQGAPFSVTGTVTSNQKIREVSVTIRDSKGKLITGHTICPDSNTFNLGAVDNYILFNILQPGKHTYKITARDDIKTVTLKIPFTVQGAPPENDSPSEVTGGASYFLGYAKYSGLNYRKQTSDKRRIAALDKAKRMATIKWKAAFSFPAWYNIEGYYSTPKAADGTVSTQFLKGKTYVGIPFSMYNHSYDDNAWEYFVKSGFSYNQIAADSPYSSSHKTTTKGVDCSFFVYLCMIAGGAKVSYQTTYSIYNGQYYKKINRSALKPGDILLSQEHVRLFAGKVGSRYAVFESTATGSKTRYKLYTSKELTGYEAYRYKKW